MTEYFHCTELLTNTQTDKYTHSAFKLFFIVLNEYRHQSPPCALAAVMQDHRESICVCVCVCTKLVQLVQ